MTGKVLMATTGKPNVHRFERQTALLASLETNEKWGIFLSSAEPRDSHAVSGTNNLNTGEVSGRIRLNSNLKFFLFCLLLVLVYFNTEKYRSRQFHVFYVPPPPVADKKP